MEKEYKWSVSGEDVFERLLHSDAVSPLVSQRQVIEMEAIYYDTADGVVSGIGGGLRLRKENGQSVCCLKLEASGSGAMKIREEYECPASTIEEGLQHLPAYGAPGALCDTLLMLYVAETCRTVFKRNATVLSTPSFTAELSFDTGLLLANGRTGTICEIELELKNGSEEAFDRFCGKLESTFSLTPQPLSKLARALALKGE